MTRADLALNLGGQVQAVRWVITFADTALVAGAGAQTIQLPPDPGGAGISLVNPTEFTLTKYSRILGSAINVTVPFKGGTLSALTMSIGLKGGSATAILAAKDIWTAAAFFDGAAILLATVSPYIPSITFTPTTTTINATTAGSLELILYVLNNTTP